MVLVNTFTVDKFGRRALLLAGFAIQATALLILSALTTAFPENSNRAAAVVEVAMLFIVGLTYCWSNGPIPPAIASEIFPQEVRDKAFGFSLLGQTCCLLALTQPWPRFNKQVGGKSYWLLFCLNTVLLVSYPTPPLYRPRAKVSPSRFRSISSYPKLRASRSSVWTGFLAKSMPLKQGSKDAALKRLRPWRVLL